ncbi:F-box/WD repeat-containing protein 12-like [Myotis daubentonii]|uniref:F-box/WD repeat-containing protein 12-like n=1 Tax=Myotis daubentonii TaxID=98922 RepID=UPI002872B0B6|nr:F-box/WD repeat-containing protein 12-like [Myotis daubentonii]
MEMQLPDVLMRHIFSFLDAASLLRAGQVSRYWKNIADEEHLWRNLCQRRWSISWEGLQVPSWKQLFLTQARRERCMMGAQPQDFAYREATGGLGILGPLAYFSGSDPSMSGQKPVICTVSSRYMLYAWDVQEGVMIWSSPVQQCKIKCLATLPQRSLAVTVDAWNTIKVWNCRDVNPLATLTMTTCCLSLEVFLTDDGPFLMIGDYEGDIYTLTVPELNSISQVNAFEYPVDHLHCSPNRKWIFAYGTHQHVLPKVFLMESLLRPAVGRAPLFVSLPFAFCSQACWALKCINRLTIMFQRDVFRRTGFTTFDLTAESTGDSTVIEAREIASFMLPGGMDVPVWMGVQDGTTVVFESGPRLFLFTIHGLLLKEFHDHENTICYLWTDSVHVLTTSRDNYLHLYMWEEEGWHPRLQSCCHLEHRKGDIRPSCYDPIAICDNTSIVCVVSKCGGASVLVMYSLNM